MDATMPDEKCDYCDISDIKLITRFKNWELVQCNRCGLRWGTPRPDPRSLPQLYDQNYFNSTQAKILGYTNYENERHLRIRTFESRFKDIEMYKPSGTCLDVGCAFGFSMEAARKRGWYTYGTDMSAYAYKILLKTGFEGTHGDFLSLDLNKTFDVVTAWDVIEHCVSPGLFMSRVYSCLKEKGILALTTPDCGSLVARLSGKRWFEYKWPEHLFYLSRQTLQLYCEKFGFQVLVSKPAIKYKFIGDAIARWIGLYETNPFLNNILGKRQMPYSSFSEVFLIAQKIAVPIARPR